MKSPERFSELLDKDLPPMPSWIGNGILPKRGILLLGGCEKIGKSMISLELARALATGTDVFGHPLLHTNPCRVLYIDQEIGEIGLKKRMEKILAKEPREVYEDRLFYVSQEPEMRLDTPQGKQAIMKAVEMAQANILVLDPIANMHEYDENNATEIGKLFTTIASIRSMFIHTDLSIVFNHHFRKPPQDDGRTHHDPLDRKNFRGSNRYLAAPDTIWTVHRTRNLQTSWEAWETTNRITLRQESSPADFRCTVNRDNDLRVKFDSEIGKPLPTLHKTKEAPLPPPVTLTGVQGKLGFTGA